jgi:hypothetical protein
VWSVFLLIGWEQAKIHVGDTRVVPIEFIHYPWSHSLALTVGWGIIFSGATYLVTRARRESIVMGLVVISHWFLDFVSHRNDMALFPGSTRWGMGLYNSVMGTIVVESALFFFGLWIYSRATKAVGKQGLISLWSFVAFVFVLYVASILGPPAPSMKAVALGNLLFLPSLFWAAWIERTRLSRH